MCAAAGCDNSVVISAATSDYLSDSADELAALTTYRCVITTPNDAGGLDLHCHGRRAVTDRIGVRRDMITHHVAPSSDVIMTSQGILSCRAGSEEDGLVCR